MPVRCEEYNQASVLAVEGDLAGETSGQLRRAVEERIGGDVVSGSGRCERGEREVADLIIDLSACPFVDSRGLETLLWAGRRCEELSGRLRLVGLGENCRKILEVTRLAHRFECQPDLEAAARVIR